MNVLVTGGAGYIGSHTLVQLLEAGHSAVVLDNFSNSSPIALERVKQITRSDFIFYEGDIMDEQLLGKIFSEQKIDAVIHFAGLKAVGESRQIPLAYYQNNVCGSLALLNAMAKHGVFRLIFSSSATVYGEPASVPIDESFPVGVSTNPYGTSKFMVEEILRDFAAAEDRMAVVLLRYFNPVGAHKSGLIGEDPRGIPNNLLPYISRVASGTLPELPVFGGDYPTPDGTGVRDYIHVDDLANGHLKALERIVSETGVYTYNLGTGNGYSVLQMISEFEKASGKNIPYRMEGRRSGDIAECFSNPSLAARELGWHAERGLAEMMADTWNWQLKNPNGYQ